MGKKIQFITNITFLFPKNRLSRIDLLLKGGMILSWRYFRVSAESSLIVLYVASCRAGRYAGTGASVLRIFHRRSLPRA